MAVFFYNIFLWLFHRGTQAASMFNAKAKKWTLGRKNIFTRLEDAIPAGTKTIWMHCASLGEFEQGRPVLEKMKELHPEYKFLLTFFSPSGYEAQKNYKGADWIFYLPMDGPRNARRFLEIVKPSLVIFVKYEFWYYYLKKIKYRNIPLLLISALFRKEMSFFKWYGGLQRKMLSRFDHLFVQTIESKQLINGIGLEKICTVTGDTRFDRVIEIAEQFAPIPLIEQFLDNTPALVAGSTWPEDEDVLQKVFSKKTFTSLKLIIAPHEINEKHIAAIKLLFPDNILFSELKKGIQHPVNCQCLILDNIGMLSRIYKYGKLAYVGGGLTSNGVHNVLEAAVYNKIVFYGPFYQKYSEAVGLIKSGGGISFDDEKKDGLSLSQQIDRLLQDKEEFIKRSNAAGAYVLSNKGATQKIIQFIQEKRLLTN